MNDIIENHTSPIESKIQLAVQECLQVRAKALHDLEQKLLNIVPVGTPVAYTEYGETKYKLGEISGFTYVAESYDDDLVVEFSVGDRLREQDRVVLLDDRPDLLNG